MKPHTVKNNYKDLAPNCTWRNGDVLVFLPPLFLWLVISKALHNTNHAYHVGSLASFSNCNTEQKK